MNHQTGAAELLNMIMSTNDIDIHDVDEESREPLEGVTSMLMESWMYADRESEWTTFDVIMQLRQVPGKVRNTPIYSPSSRVMAMVEFHRQDSRPCQCELCTELREDLVS
jgi:hypothetical protein